VILLSVKQVKLGGLSSEKKVNMWFHCQSNR